MGDGMPDFRTLFENAPGLLLILHPDRNWTILAVTNSYAKATMTSREQIVGKGLFEVFPDNPADPNATGERNLRASLERALDTKRMDTMAVQKYDIRKPDGSFEARWWSPTNSPVLEQDHVVYMIHRVEDVTDYIALKSEQQELTQLRDRAQRMEIELFLRGQELQAANQELRKARAAADAANEAKSEFLSSMSHELRTPLNAIIGFSELLYDGQVKPDSANHKEFLGDILHSGRHLLQLINGVLDLARVESGKVPLKIEAVDVDAVVREVATALAPLLDRAGISFKWLGLIETLKARADRTRLAQILLNFGSNAIKYGVPNGQVTVSAEPIGKKIRISVADDGIGIPLEKQSKLFEPFQRLGQELSGIEGTGIGLALSRKLAHIMDGEVGFISAVRKGSTFWVDLPST